MTERLVSHGDDGRRVDLHDPQAMPQASAFLWNRHMLLQANCQGYVSAQHLQPEPARYSHAPVLEQKTFMQPEQPTYAHHPGRFVYVKDEQDGDVWSAPYAPVLQKSDRFCFSASLDAISWRCERNGIAIDLQCRLPDDAALELWTLTISNIGDRQRAVSVYPVFTIGYMSWMNQSAAYDDVLGAIIARSITPYQKLEDYPRVSQLRDCSFLLHEQAPVAWEACARSFEGNGGLHNPDAVREPRLGDGDALYESPIAALQYRLELEPAASRTLRLVFGPARDAREILEIRDRYLAGNGFDDAKRRYESFLARGKACLNICTVDKQFDDFVNYWLPRQVYYHGSVNRLTLDPQTRNYLQDNLGMSYIDPATTRRAFLFALSQQDSDGGMPEGIVLDPSTTLKYINQVPHTDHCVWLPVCLQAYIDETGDTAILTENLRDAGGSEATVLDRVTAALRWLVRNRDARGLSLINQGDWCDPMNMVGPEGRGVSGWLSIATVHALQIWTEICAQACHADAANGFTDVIDEMRDAIVEHLWDGDWFARGITDNGRVFGGHRDSEGRIYLNPQSWALLAGITTPEQNRRLLRAVEEQLHTPFGSALLAPAYTAMQDDIGRVTQKFPGTAENGAIYNHASAFYIAALYRSGESERAWQQLRRALPGPDREDYLRRGQLPVFVPNYYRGAVQQFPRTAGRSSQLFNTGAASWLYRIVIEQLFGLRGCADGLIIAPQLPADWHSAEAHRRFRGADFHILFTRDASIDAMRVDSGNACVVGNVVRDIQAGTNYTINVRLPSVDTRTSQSKMETMA